MSAVTRPSSRPPAARTTSVVITGIISPPPRPCRTRAAISAGAFQARAAATDPARKTSRENSQSRLPPNRAVAHVLSGTVMPRASR